MAQNIDTQSLSDIITEFRRITAKDAITPENLGYILQRIADLLATAGSSETSTALWNWYNTLRVAPDYISGLAQGTGDPDRLNLLAVKNKLSPGETASMQNIPIAAATTENAGVMAAGQVSALLEATQNIKDLGLTAKKIDSRLTQLYNRLGLSGDDTVPNSFHKAQIAVRIINGKLNVIGAASLMKAGFVPYIFRHTKKRNPYRDKKSNALTRYCPETKGWHLYGSRYAVKVVGTQVLFSSNKRNALHRPAKIYSSDPNKLINMRILPNGHRTVAWGRSMIDLRDVKSKAYKERLVRLRFAIGFAKPVNPGSSAFTPANLVSSLAEFSLIYDPHFASWKLSR